MKTIFTIVIALFSLVLPAAAQAYVTTIQIGSGLIHVYTPINYYPGHAATTYATNTGAYRNGQMPLSYNMSQYQMKAATQVHMTPQQYAVFSAKPPQKPVW